MPSVARLWLPPMPLVSFFLAILSQTGLSMVIKMAKPILLSAIRSVRTPLQVDISMVIKMALLIHSSLFGARTSKESTYIRR